MNPDRICLSLALSAIFLQVAATAFEAPARAPLPKVSDQELNDLERDAGKCRTARRALDRYEAFAACHELTSRQRESIEARMKVWRGRVEAGQCRVGNTWVTPAAAKEIGEAADKLIEEARLKIIAGEFKRAKELLEKAVRADPSGTRADFELGILNTPNLWNFAPAAEKYFEHAYRRDPENSSLQNNLAISRVKMGKYGEALDLWADALRAGVEVPDVVHNVARFAEEAKAKRLPASDAQRKRAEKMYERALAGKKGPPAREKTGWLYSRLVLSADERERSELSRAESTAEISQSTPPAAVPEVEIGNGTGFVIAPGLVLTNRHVAEAGTGFRIPEPGEVNRDHRAKVLAICKEMDLAILRCEALQAPPVALKSESIRRGTEVLILGFPLSDVLGRSLKAVRGSIYGFEDDRRRDVVLYEASTNPGNSGGPVCDNSGRVIAVHFAGLNLAETGKFAGKFGIGVPVEKALPFIRESVPGIDESGTDSRIEWPDVDEKVSRSTVLIRIFDRSVPFVAKVPTQKGIDIFEDRTCVACKGRRTIPCPVRGCYRGSVSDFENSYQVVEQGYGQIVIRTQKPKLASCPGCKGKGVVDCAHCRDGTDPRLK